MVVTVLVLYEPPSTGQFYDPASRSGGGLAVVVDVLDELGVEVRVSDTLPSPDDVDAVLAPPLGWQDDELRALAEQGVRVVAVVPPTTDSELVAAAVEGLGPVTREVDCPVLAGVRTLRSSSWSSWQVPVGTLPQDATRCVGEGSVAWATLLPLGEGTLVALGTMAPLVNERTLVDGATTAAVRLLDARAGDRVVALTTPEPDDADPGLLDLVDVRWFDAAGLTLLALVLVALARGRRLGRPVTEELPVRVPSGELARATGDLRHRIGADAAAVEHLRTRTLTVVGTALGLGPAPDPQEAVAALRAAGTTLREADEDALAHAPGTTTDGTLLQATAARLARIRRTVRAIDPDGDGRDGHAGAAAVTDDTRPDDTEQP